jgi:hypothetical protein
VSAAHNISRNVRRFRRAKGWGQDEAAERMTAASGVKWTNATWSAAERSPETGRPKSWKADEVAALADLFGVAVGALFADPDQPCPTCGGMPPAGFTCNACGGTR